MRLSISSTPLKMLAQSLSALAEYVCALPEQALTHWEPVRATVFIQAHPESAPSVSRVLRQTRFALGVEIAAEEAGLSQITLKVRARDVRQLRERLDYQIRNIPGVKEAHVLINPPRSLQVLSQASQVLAIGSAVLLVGSLLGPVAVDPVVAGIGVFLGGVVALGLRLERDAWRQIAAK